MHENAAQNSERDDLESRIGGARLRQCAHKIIYIDYEEASGKAKLMHKRHKAPFVAYRCQFCAGFHVGRVQTPGTALRRSQRKAEVLYA